MKAISIILAAACVVLAGALVYRHNSADRKSRADEVELSRMSNELRQATARLDEQRTVNVALERELETRATELKSASNSLSTISDALNRTKADVEAARAAATAAETAMKQRDARIAELEGEKDDLSKRMTDLSGSISQLESIIAETKRKLSASEGDREFLMKELKRLQAEKAELERRFQDMAVLRDQVRKLKDELSVSRRLEWIRRGIYGDQVKGGERLQRSVAGAGPARPGTNVQGLSGASSAATLNAEVRRDGTARIGTNAVTAPKATNTVAPTRPATNAAPAVRAATNAVTAPRPATNAVAVPKPAPSSAPSPSRAQPPAPTPAKQ